MTEYKARKKRQAEEDEKVAKTIAKILKTKPTETQPPIQKHGTPTNKDRLDYYRTHGLSDCKDYPGGDTQFQLDVLSGQFHDSTVTDTPMKKEDQYIQTKMYSGLLKFGPEFNKYIRHPMLILAYYENANKNNFTITDGYPGGPIALRIAVLSGQYAKERMQGR